MKIFIVRFQISIAKQDLPTDSQLTYIKPMQNFLRTCTRLPNLRIFNDIKR